MRIDIITIFPRLFESSFSEGTIARAQEKKILELHIVDLRQYTSDKRRSVDDYPYGGGDGMVMMAAPIAHATRTLRTPEARVILLSPQGRRYTQRIARDLSDEKHMILICGRYKGVDERVRCGIIDDEISIGDYVLSGGEFAAMVVTESVTRLLPGALGNADSIDNDSFSTGLLDAPWYTRPADFEGMLVPEVLLSGNHQEIRTWRKREALKRTLVRRPDLLATAPLSEEDLKILDTLRNHEMEDR